MTGEEMMRAAALKDNIDPCPVYDDLLLYRLGWNAAVRAILRATDKQGLDAFLAVPDADADGKGGV